MKEKYINEAISKIDESGKERPYLQSKFRVNENQVCDAERKIGFSFPESFRHFLLNYGSGDFGGREFYGLVPGDNNLEEAPNSLWLTLDLRARENLPDDFYVIEDIGDGTTACLLLSHDSKGECPVVLWDYGEGNVDCPHVLAQSFGEYFYERIDEILSRNTE